MSGLAVRRLGASALAALALVVAGQTTADAQRSAAAVAPTAPVTVVPEQASGWSYLTTPYEGYYDTAYAATGYDDSGWAVGQGGFGTADSFCSFNTPSTVHTPWSGDGDEQVIYLRRHFTVPAGTTSIRVHGTVDNGAIVWVNGVEYTNVYTGDCEEDLVDVTVPASALTADNVIAVGTYNGGGPAFIDLSITASVPLQRATVTGVSPPSGPPVGGSSVTITGEHFTGASKVLFGTVPATSYTVVSDTEIQATVPARGSSPKVVQVRVQTAGLSAKSPAARFKYVG